MIFLQSADLIPVGGLLVRKKILLLVDADENQ